MYCIYLKKGFFDSDSIIVCDYMIVWLFNYIAALYIIHTCNRIACLLLFYQVLFFRLTAFLVSFLAVLSFSLSIIYQPLSFFHICIL